MTLREKRLGNRFSALFVGRVTVNSAAKLSLWLCSVTVVCFSLAAFVQDSVLRWALFAVGLLPVINAIVTIQRLKSKLLTGSFGDDGF